MAVLSPPATRPVVMRIVLSLAIASILLANTAMADWPQFRGPNSSGIGSGASVPVEFGPGKNELWSTPLAAGHSSPCIVGDSIFLTTFDKERRQLGVVCLARASGEIRWQRAVPVRAFEKGHPSFNPASSSPASDGERVVAYFGSYGLVCFDMQGEKLWEIKMPITRSFAGNATSPIIAGDLVILYRGNHVDHFLLAVDKKTGKEIWRVPQEEPFTSEMACTACPIVAGEKLIVHTARSVQAFEISTGKQVWVAKCATTATSTPVLAGKEVIVAAWNKMGEPVLRPTFPSFEQLLVKHDKDGDKLISRDELPRLWIFHRPEGAEAPQNGATVRFERVDKDRNRTISADEWSQQLQNLEKIRAGYGTHGMLAIPIDSQGSLKEEQVRTLDTNSIPEVPSPLYHDGHVYYVKNGGILTCLELATGKRVYRIRTRGTGTHYASPIIADGKLFSLAGNGLVSVIRLGPRPMILASNDLGEETYASPAIVDGTIYIRTHTRLYAFGLKK
jgi:outer membrane protein assembly factor BamB